MQSSQRLHIFGRLVLVYELAVAGWMPIFDSSNYIQNHTSFGPLHSNGVRFYDEKSYLDTFGLIGKLSPNMDLYPYSDASCNYLSPLCRR